MELGYIKGGIKSPKVEKVKLISNRQQKSGDQPVYKAISPLFSELLETPKIIPQRVYSFMPKLSMGNIHMD